GDIVNGGTGQDSLELQGSFASESLVLVEKDQHLIAEHDLDEAVDASNIESVKFTGFGGLDETGAGDTVSVGETLSRAGVTHVTADFTDPIDNLGPNNSADTLQVLGTAKVDNITVSSSGPDITVAGLATTVDAVNLDHQDTLRIDTLAGRD